MSSGALFHVPGRYELQFVVPREIRKTCAKVLVEHGFARSLKVCVL